MHEEMQKMKEQLESAEKDKKKLSEKFLDKPIRPGGKFSVSTEVTVTQSFVGCNEKVPW